MEISQIIDVDRPYMAILCETVLLLNAPNIQLVNWVCCYADGELPTPRLRPSLSHAFVYLSATDSLLLLHFQYSRIEEVVVAGIYYCALVSL